MMVTAVALTGCSKAKEPAKAPEVVVKEAMQTMSAAKVMSMVMTADVNVKAIDKVKTGFETAHFSGKFDLGFDMNDAKTPKMSLKMEGKGAQDKDKEDSASGELILLGNTLYASLTNMSDFKGSVPVAIVQPYFGKWWSVAVPEEFTKDLSVYSKDEKDLTPEEKKMKDLYNGKNLFKNVKYQGGEKVEDVDTYVYSAELDKEELKKLIVEMSKAQGQELSADELKKMDESWNTLTFAGKLYVSQKDMSMKKIGVNIELKDLEGADVDMDLAFVYNSLGGAVAIEAPKDATPFDLGALLGGMGGTPTLDPALAEPDSIPVTPAD